MSIAKVSILGTELLVGDPVMLKTFAWATWAYFLLRYYQYFKSESDAEIIRHAANYFKFLARQHVLKSTGRTSLLGEIVLARRRLRWGYTLAESPANVNGKIETGAFPLILGGWWVLRAYLHVALHTPKVTDHVLPFALAVATPLVIAARTI